MCALEISGPRKIRGDQKRAEQPSEDQCLERPRRPAQDEQERDRRQHEEDAEEPDRNEGAVTRGRQRVVPRRRMHERLDIGADRLWIHNATQTIRDAVAAAPSLTCARIVAGAA